MKNLNFILLTIDTLRADRIGKRVNGVSLTPHLDRLANSGIRFEQAITGGSWTQAAFPVLLTSSYASMYRGCLGPLAPERPSPVETLARCGYSTAGFTTNPLIGRTYGYERGFNQFYELIPGEKDPSLRKIKGGEHLLRSPLTHYFYNWIGRSARPPRLYSPAEELTTCVSQWLTDAQKPFFVWAHYMDTHWPYHLEETLNNPSAIAQAWRDMGYMYRANWKGEQFTSDQRDRFTGLYEKALSYVDAQIGKMLDHLEHLGHLADTVIILVSDHGEEFLERGRWGHLETNLYDEVIKVPLIIYLPDIPGADSIKHQVRTMDIMPTILDLAGCPAPSGILGESLVPLWNNQDSQYRAEVSISEMWRDHWQIVAARTETHKYIWDSRKPDQPRLYDLIADSMESINIVNESPEKRQYFQTIVADHLNSVSKNSSTSPSLEPQLDSQVAQRLRDLGYLE